MVSYLNEITQVHILWNKKEAVFCRCGVLMHQLPCDGLKVFSEQSHITALGP